MKTDSQIETKPALAGDDGSDSSSPLERWQWHEHSQGWVASAYGYAVRIERTLWAGSPHFHVRDWLAHSPSSPIPDRKRRTQEWWDYQQMRWGSRNRTLRVSHAKHEPNT